jgi:hypothetical protein
MQLIIPPAAKFALLSAFFALKTSSAVEIHHELRAVYDQNVMRDGTIRQLCRMFKAGRTNIDDEERSGGPSVVGDDLVRSVDQKICGNRCFTISELSCEFPQISRAVLYEIITVRLGYHKFCAAWVTKTITGVHKKQRMAPTSPLLERYHKDEFLNHIVRVIGD